MTLLLSWYIHTNIQDPVIQPFNKSECLTPSLEVIVVIVKFEGLIQRCLPNTTHDLIDKDIYSCTPFLKPCQQDTQRDPKTMIYMHEQCQSTEAQPPLAKPPHPSPTSRENLQLCCGQFEIIPTSIVLKLAKFKLGLSQ